MDELTCILGLLGWIVMIVGLEYIQQSLLGSEGQA